jgi:hypothetical protein
METIKTFEDELISIDLATVSSITTRSVKMALLHCTSGQSYAVRGTLEEWTRRVRAAKGLLPITEDEVNTEVTEAPVDTRPKQDIEVVTRPAPDANVQTRPMGGKKKNRNR